MKITKITPIRINRSNEGLLDIEYVRRCGFLWLRSERVRRTAMNTTGILWQWADSPGDYLFDLTAIVAGYSEELLSGEQVIISSGQKPYDGLAS